MVTLYTYRSKYETLGSESVKIMPVCYEEYRTFFTVKMSVINFLTITSTN